MALMPPMLALVVRARAFVPSMNGTDANYVGSCCESTSIHSMNGIDALYVGSPKKSQSQKNREIAARAFARKLNHR